MLVKFTSSESGEIVMFAEAAHDLLMLLGKGCTAHGVFRRDEMLAAAVRLRRSLPGKEVVDAEGGETAAQEETTEAEESKKERPVGLAQRAWPLIDMLERTSKGDERAHITWQAPKDF